MPKFIAYFDFLGYKSFIVNNDIGHVRRRVFNILHDVEHSVGQGKKTRKDYGYVPDISLSRLNCLNISDTIIFWTSGQELESFIELLKASFEFNHIVNCSHFPVRGAIVYDEIDCLNYDSENQAEGLYRVNSIFGVGLVRAYEKAENLNFAGCVIDHSAINRIQEFCQVDKLLENYAVLYKVPYKREQCKADEYVLRFTTNKKINDQAFENRKKGILRAFQNDKKEFTKRAAELFDNTIRFLEKNKE